MGQAGELPSGTASRTSADPPAEEQPDLTGKTLDDFLVLRRLGQGGMGQVYLAEQISLRRKVALKILRPDLAANATSLQRFKAEALAVARATHANIVQIYAVKEADGVHFMALEYVEGRNLRQYLEKKGPPEIFFALSIMRQVAAALQRASELGIIHRDIKPENILVTRKGEVKVADFGLSRVFAENAQPVNLTQTGVTMGTPLYMSPEQVEGKPIDPRTDIYSFGVTCYHMLAGEPPFRGQSAFEVAVQHVQKDPAPLGDIRPDLPAELCAIVHKMMAKRPEDRFQTGREIAREVARLRDSLVGVTGALSGGGAVVTMGPGAAHAGDAASTQTILPLRPRRRLGWLFALSVLLALGGGLGYGWWRSTTDLLKAPRPAPVGKAAETPEALLLERVKHHTDPKTPLDASSGLADRINLGLLYLRERRLDEAEEFFKGLDRPDHIRSYQSLGQVGRAMTLAFQDRPKESQQLFQKWMQTKGRKRLEEDGPRSRVSLGPLYETIATALNHNHANQPDVTFPPGLENLRHPPRPKGFPFKKKAQKA